MTSTNENDQSITENRRLEYTALRQEILKRMDFRYQFISISLSIAGVFLGFGITNGQIALVYPPLAVFLAIGWAQNDLRVTDLATYIREHIEKNLPGTGWEAHVQKERVKTRNRKWRSTILSHGGILIFTQLIAMGIGWLKFTFTPLEWVLLAVDAIAVIIVIQTVWKIRQ
jgi:hypothetical protein